MPSNDSSAERNRAPRICRRSALLATQRAWSSRAAIAALVVGSTIAHASENPGSEAGRRVVLVNADFESLKPGLFRYPEGWVGIQHAGDQSYTFKLDSDERHRGQRSVRIDNVGPEPFGLVYQQVSVRDLRGSVVQLSGWLRTRGATGSATGGGGVLMLQAMRAGSPLAHNHMTANPAKGDTEWTRYAIVLSIPALADQIEVGAMLHGPGTLWIDDIELTVLPK